MAITVLDTITRTNLIENGLAQLNSVRRQAWAASLKVWFVGPPLLVMAAFIWFNDSTAIVPTLFVASAGAICWLVFAAQQSATRGVYVQTFESWRELVLKAMSCDAMLEPGNVIRSSEFDQSGINRLAYNLYGGGNLLKVGDWSACTLAVNNERQETYYETVWETDNQGRSSSRQVQRTRTVIDPVYHGIFLRVQAPMPHPGWVLVNHRKAGVGRGFEMMDPLSPYLRKNHAIGGTTGFLSHRILTPSMQVAIETVSRDSQSCVAVSFRDHVMFVAFPNLCLNVGEVPPTHRNISPLHLDAVITSCQNTLLHLHRSVEQLKHE